MILYAAISMATTVAAFAALAYIVLRHREFLVRPSVIFLGTFCLQVELASAINAKFVFEYLSRPWIYFLLVHAFPLAVLAILPWTFRQATADAHVRLQEGAKTATLGSLLTNGAALLFVIYSILFVYLIYVPFSQTGFYDLLQEPRYRTDRRELSMKLLDMPLLQYAFAFLEKVLAPVAAAFFALGLARAWHLRNIQLLFVALAGICLASAPTIIYGARGPPAMVLLAAAFTLILIRRTPLTVRATMIALVFVLMPAFIVMVAQARDYSIRGVAFQGMNALDRAIGRGFIDNVWHLSFVEECGFHGIGAFPKIAGFVGVPPIDIMNIVGRINFAEFTGFGILVPGVNDDMHAGKLGLKKKSGKSQCIVADEIKAEPKRRATDLRREVAPIDVSRTVSASASFLILNYASFGILSWFFSLAFVISMDFILLLYRRMPAVAVAVAVGASSVPILTLSSTFFTTVLASHGLLLVPIVSSLTAIAFGGDHRFWGRRRRN
jgi:hypothetical protein